MPSTQAVPASASGALAAPDASGRDPVLAAVAGIAARLSAAAPLDEVLPAVLDALRELLGAAACSLWLREDDDALRHRAGDAAGATAADVRGLLAGAPAAGPGHAHRLRAGDRELGTLVLHGTGPLAPPLELALATVAHLLAPAVAHEAGMRRLELEVASRTRQIEEERRFTERIIDSLPMGLYVIDRDYRIQVWNHKRETGLQGVSRDEAIGRTIFEILHRQPAEMLRREFEEVFRTGRVQHFNMESNTTGDLRYYRITKIPMRAGGGGVTHVITVGEDVTEWREAQERFAQAEKLAAIGQLAAGVMHEINNPLATIAACAESLGLALDDARVRGSAVPGECTEYLRIVESEVHRSKRIVDRLLEFSRPKPLAPEPVDLNAVVEQTLFLLKHHSRFKKFTVQTALVEPAPVARGNTEQLVQVLMALLINAMDSMADLGTIEVRTVLAAGPARQVGILVRDQGHGIPRSQLGKIFEPFYTTKAPGRGTGLGLSICYGIVAEHGGRLEVDSAVGEGTTFRILLPEATA